MAWENFFFFFGGGGGGGVVKGGGGNFVICFLTGHLSNQKVLHKTFT